MADNPPGRRASDHIAMQQGIALAEHGIMLRGHAEEIERVRAFKHDINNAVQTLVTKVGTIQTDIEKVLRLGERVAGLEEDQAVHAAKCDERYKDITEYMADSKQDRLDIKKAQDDAKAAAIRGIIAVLVALVLGMASIIGLFLWTFGLPRIPT